MEHPLKTLWEKPSRLVIGFMSGTSADGVDAALVRITGYGTQTRAEQLGFRFVPFSDEVRAEILRLAGKSDIKTAKLSGRGYFVSDAPFILAMGVSAGMASRKEGCERF